MLKVGMLKVGLFNQNGNAFYVKAFYKSLLYFKSLITASLLILLSACGEHYEEQQNTPIVNYFEVVDSFGYSSIPFHVFNENHGVYADHLLVSPIINDGYFELWWDVSHYNAYSTLIYINDRPTHFGAYELEAISCKNQQNCNNTGFAYCFYNRYANNSKIGHKDTLSCSTQARENEQVDITSLFYDHPQDLYMIIEVCEDYTGNCNSQSQRITFE